MRRCLRGNTIIPRTELCTAFSGANAQYRSTRFYFNHTFHTSRLVFTVTVFGQDRYVKEGSTKGLRYRAPVAPLGIKIYILMDSRTAAEVHGRRPAFESLGKWMETLGPSR